MPFPLDHVGDGGGWLESLQKFKMDVARCTSAQSGFILHRLRDSHVTRQSLHNGAAFFNGQWLFFFFLVLCVIKAIKIKLELKCPHTNSKSKYHSKKSLFGFLGQKIIYGKNAHIMDI